MASSVEDLRDEAWRSRRFQLPDIRESTSAAATGKVDGGYVVQRNIAQARPKILVRRHTHSEFRRGSDAESCGDRNELRKRISLHLLHDLASMRLDGDLADAETIAHLFVQQAGDHQLHDLAFALRERSVAVAKGLNLRLVSEGHPAPLDRFADRVQ